MENCILYNTQALGVAKQQFQRKTSELNCFSEQQEWKY